MPWYEKNYTRNLVVLVLFFLFIYLLHQVTPLLDAATSFFNSVFLPFFLSLVIYYAVRPFVHFLNKKMNILLSISIVYIILLGIIVFLVFFVYPKIIDELNYLGKIDFKKITSLSFLQYFNLDPALMNQLKNTVLNFFTVGSKYISENFLVFLKFLATILLDICFVPFILFYLLKDDKKIYSSFTKIFSQRYRYKIRQVLSEIDNTLVDFINGRVIVAAILGTLLFFSFLIIGINFYYLLAFISFILFIIPSVGWILASIFPVIIGFSMSISMGVQVSIIMLAAAALEGAWLTPQILGISMTIHPLTIIILLMVSGYFYGLTGLIFITPAYALLKIVASHLYYFFYPRKKKVEN